MECRAGRRPHESWTSAPALDKATKIDNKSLKEKKKAEQTYFKDSFLPFTITMCFTSAPILIFPLPSSAPAFGLLPHLILIFLVH